MARLLSDRYFWLIVAIGVFIGVFIYIADFAHPSWLPSHEDWEPTYIALQFIMFLVAVVIATRRYGLKGGLATSFGIGLILILHLIVSPEFYVPGVWLETGIIIVVGVVISRLIAQRKRVEEELKASEEHYRSLVESSPDCICHISLDGKFLDMNTAGRVLNELDDPAEVIGRGCTASIVENRQAAEEAVRQAVRGGTASIQYKSTGKRGREIWWDSELTPIRDMDGTVISILRVSRDITERRKTEETLREAETLREVDRLRTQLLGNLSHELRTPLTSIKGFVTTLLSSDVKWGEEEQRGFLQTINQEADRLNHLIGDLLELSHLQAGAVKLKRGRRRLSEILDSVSDKLAHLTEGHQLQVTVPARLPLVYVDEIRIGQVLINLVENAAKYSRKGGPIKVEARFAGGRVVVSVADHGDGIPAEFLDRVFDSFYQVEDVASGRKGGSGLGLSICRDIIEAHGEKIWVESKVGRGSKFSFSLGVHRGE